jgi:hypothetical protein
MKRGSLILLVLFVGCGPHFESGKTLCSDKGECPGGFFCSNNVCVDSTTSGRGGIGGTGSGGTGGIGGNPGPPSTKGDACNTLGASACPPLLACYPSSYTSVSQCVQDFVSGCCGSGGTCSLSVSVDANAFQLCNVALARMSCAEVTSLATNLTPPSACTSYTTSP